MSGLRVFGRTWHCGPEDLVVPAACNTFTSVPMVVVSALAYVALRDDTLSPTVCDLTNDLRAYALGMLVLYASALCLDALVAWLAWHTRLFHPAPGVVHALYVRLACVGAILVFTVLGTVWYVDGDTVACLEFPLDSVTRLQRLLLALVVVNWIAMGMFMTSLWCSYNSGGTTPGARLATCESRIRCISCYCCWGDRRGDGGGDDAASHSEVFNAVALVMDTLLEANCNSSMGASALAGAAAATAAAAPGSLTAGADTPLVAGPGAPANTTGTARGTSKHMPHTVASDIVVGFTLVQSAQHLRRARGDRFRYAENHKFPGATAPSPGASAPAAGDQKNAPQPAAAAGAAAAAPVEDAALLALSGVQPHLNDTDAAELERARYYVKYAMGAYGWMLYTFLHPVQSLCGALCCGCGIVTPPGAVTGSCCWRCSENAFLQTTGVQEADILGAHLDSGVARSVFWMVADRARKSLVIAVRGTLSLPDMITDMNCSSQKLPASFGPGDHYAHAGIWANVSRLHTELTGAEGTTLHRFLDAHPDYSVVVCGHSLGAASAALLTLLLRQHFVARAAAQVAAGKPNARAVDVHGYAYAPPPIVDEALAQSAATRALLTSVVYQNDVIAHLSLASLLRLKRQMHDAFRVCVPYKWQVLSHAWHRRHHAIWLRDAQGAVAGISSSSALFPVQPQQQPVSSGAAASAATAMAAGHEPNDLADVAAEAAAAGESVTAPPALAITIRPEGATPSPASSSAADVKLDISTPRVAAAVVAAATVPAVSPSQLSDVRLSTPGRVFHILNTTPKRRGCCSALRNSSCCGPDATYTVYAAHHKSFDEIVIHWSMFKDHMPEFYVAALNGIVLPSDGQRHL